MCQSTTGLVPCLLVNWVSITDWLSATQMAAIRGGRNLKDLNLCCLTHFVSPSPLSHKCVQIFQTKLCMNHHALQTWKKKLLARFYFFGLLKLMIKFFFSTPLRALFTLSLPFPFFLYPAAQGMYQSSRTKYSRLVYRTAPLGRQART